MKYILLVFLGLFSVIILSAQTNSIETTQHGGMTREYRLYVPAAYDGSESVPLVFNLHGYTSNAIEQENYGNFKSIADTANFILVHPEGTEDNNGDQFWNVFGAASPDDVDFISALIDEIDGSYNIDLNQVYSTGMSNGGFMSFELACSLGDRIAAVASVTGAMPRGKFNTCNAPKATPIMQIHGTDDATVPYNGNTLFEPVEDIVDFWVDQTNCNPTPTITDMPDIDDTDGSTAERYLYEGGDQNTTVEHFKIINGGHTWPGSAFEIAGLVTNQDIDASVEIWRFFRKYSLDQLTASVVEEEPKEVFKIYPNPSDGIINFEFDESVNSYLILDALGREITKNKSIQSKETIQIKQKGIYFIQLKSDSGSVTKKFIVK